MTCGWRGVCETARRAKNWVSISVQQDFGVVRTTGACSNFAQEHEGYACYRGDGEPYLGTPVLTNEPLGAGVGPTRIAVGYDRLVHYRTTLGVRLGWAVAGELPTPRLGTRFVPFSAAVRVAYWFGDDPFARSGARPFVFVTGGYSMVDIDVGGTTFVREDPLAYPYQGGNPLEQELEVHKRAGDAFVGVGVGAAFALTGGLAVFVEAAALKAFPFGAVVLAPAAGAMVGF
jgi:hypothetical protein